MGGNLFERLAAPWRDRPGRTVLEIPGGRSWSWADIDALSGRIAAVLLAAGLTAGDRVSVQVAKSPEAVTLYLACLRAGGRGGAAGIGGPGAAVDPRCSGRRQPDGGCGRCGRTAAGAARR